MENGSIYFSESMALFYFWKGGWSVSDIIILFGSEFFGTAILMFLGCLGCVANMPDAMPTPPEQQALAFGVAVLIAIQCFGHISGAHINPIVSIASFLLGYTALIELPVYFSAQILGAIAGYGLVWVSTPRDVIYTATLMRDNSTQLIGVCSPHISLKISVLQGFLIEFLISFMLTLLCCGIWDRRNGSKMDSVPIRFGLAVAGISMAAGVYTTAQMNPARSLGPALVNGNWDYHWLFWVAPVSASIVASLGYRFLFDRNSEDIEDGKGD